MRPNFIQDPSSPYHVTARCLNREWFSIPMPEVWSIAEDLLYFVANAFRLDIHAFVLMANHYHLLLTALEGNLSEAMAWFQREMSREIGRRAGRSNTIWGGRFHRSRIDSERYFRQAYKYIYLNPVKAGVCDRVEDYPYSSIQSLLGLSPAIIPLKDPWDIGRGMGELDFTLEWLNRRPPEEEWSQVGHALRRKVYQLPRVDSRASSLESVEWW